VALDDPLKILDRRRQHDLQRAVEVDGRDRSDFSPMYGASAILTSGLD
jgi:hypothetical protein